MEAVSKTYSPNDRVKYDIVTLPRALDGTTRRSHAAGTAFQYESEPYYVVKIWTFPSSTFYMVKKEGVDGEYVIYSRVNQTGQGPKFSNPVGRGVLDPASKTQLKMTFFLLGFSVLMDLYPSS